MKPTAVAALTAGLAAGFGAALLAGWAATRYLIRLATKGAQS